MLILTMEDFVRCENKFSDDPREEQPSPSISNYDFAVQRTTNLHSFKANSENIVKIFYILAALGWDSNSPVNVYNSKHFFK